MHKIERLSRTEVQIVRESEDQDMDPDMSTTSIKDLAPPVPDDPPPKPQTIFLHILSPSSEVPDKLTFPAIPVTTTVDELKNKIQDAITTKPSPQRQRLIYRGKALVKPTDTMKDVFGQDTVRLRNPPENTGVP